jgi:hypothetical protein
MELPILQDGQRTFSRGTIPGIARLVAATSDAPASDMIPDSCWSF